MGRLWYQIGYDLEYLNEGLRVPISIPLGHTIWVGASGSGKSCSALNTLYQLHRQLIATSIPFTIYVADFKESGTFYSVTEKYYTFTRCIDGIREFYQLFWELPEGGNGVSILLIDEVAGLINFYEMADSKVAKELKTILTNLLMLGRSRQVYIFQICQRATASLYLSASGSLDNVNTKIALANLTSDSKLSLFQGADFKKLEGHYYQRGQGVVSIEGMPLIEIEVPNINTSKIEMYFMSFRNARQPKTV